MKKVLTIGGATQDIIIEYQEGSSLHIENTFPLRLSWQEGGKIEIEHLHYASGGGATNTAASFERLGFEASTFFKIGNDAAGHAIVQDLERLGTTVHYTSTDTLQTGTSFVIPIPGKDSIIFSYQGANETLSQKEYPVDLIKEQDFIYISSLTNKAADALPHLTHNAQKYSQGKGIRVAVNPGTNQLKNNAPSLKAALSSIDVLIMNTEEMKLFATNLKPRHFKSSGSGIITSGPPLARAIISAESITFTLHEYLKEILSHKVKRVVITDGKNGVYVATKDTLYFHPALPVPVVNSLGAGDAFGSCFVAQLIQGKRIEDALFYGLVNAASVIGFHDAKTGLLSQKKLEEYKENLDTSFLQTYPLHF
ncbi:carbohydrate kinase family protein [Candidatus Babeliales bacterium]|nr:carbohydrate kinase family protein [Candidatus Babeliales bacterium]